MASSIEDCKDDKNTKSFNGMHWTDVKIFQHRHLINVPSKSRKSLPFNIEEPTPLFDPLPVTNYNEYKKLFCSQPKLDTRLAYYRKLHSKTNKQALKKMIQEQEFTNLPQYVIDVAHGAFEDCEDRAWCYTGGTLDLLSFNNDEFIVKAGFKQSIQVTNVNTPSINVNIKLKEETPIYNIKSIVHNKNAHLAVRQKYRMSVFNFSYDNLESSYIWRVETTGNPFVDMTFNEMKKNELAFINTCHKLEVKDYITKYNMIMYDFPTDFSHHDNFAQIHYVDCNTLGFINRCCVYLLDLRSLSTKTSCLRTTWLKCDDLCTFSKNLNSFYISSKHNIINYDIRSMKETDRMLHMLPTPPVMSSFIQNTEEDIICLSGQRCSDKVLLHSSCNKLNIPFCVPNTSNGFIKAALTKKIDISDYLEERLSLPTIGMKLHKNSNSADINLYTVNSAGDVFKQCIQQNKLNNDNEVTNKLAEWISKIPYKPKALEATSICNSSNIVHSISRRFPKEDKLKSLMKENTKLPLFEKEYFDLKKCLESNVGESMNAIWDDEKHVVEENANLISEVSSKHKVSEWLDSVM